MTTKARKAPIITNAQEARIQAGIARDPDSREASDEQLARMRPASEVLPAELYARLTRPRGRPKAAETKEPVKLRLDRKAVAAFRQSGSNWQTRINAIIVREAKSLRAAPPKQKVVEQIVSDEGVLFRVAASKPRSTKAAAKKRT